VMAAVQEGKMKIPAEEVQVQEVRGGHSGHGSSPVHLPRRAVDIVLDQGKVKVGWTGNRVVERILLPTCRRCQKVGHEHRDCEAEPATNFLCHRCGALGHIMGRCNADKPKCYSCDGEHAANSMSCPAYRKAVSDLREARRHGPQANPSTGGRTKAAGKNATTNKTNSRTKATAETPAPPAGAATGAEPGEGCSASTPEEQWFTLDRRGRPVPAPLQKTDAETDAQPMDADVANATTAAPDAQASEERGGNHQI
jgi:hypothetical protein